MTIQNYVNESLKGFREKKRRIRTIFLYFRDLEKFGGISDIVILNSIINGLNDLRFPYSENEVYSAFKEVDKEDYGEGLKKQIIKNLLINANKKTVFN